MLTLVPLDVGVSALPGLGGPCGFLLDVLVAVDFSGLLGVLRCIVVPVVGFHVPYEKNAIDFKKKIP